MTRAQGKIWDDFPEGSRILLSEQIVQLEQRLSLIQPFAKGNLAPCSYDFCAGSSYVQAGGGATDNTSKEPLTLGPGSYAGLISREKVKIPPNMYVMLGPKRKLSYEGIILLSGSVVDPGYEGHLLFVLYNSSGKKRVIYPGKKICVATFFQLDKSVPNPIGPDPSLSAGNFPGEFLDSMANMELPSMVEITEKLKSINDIQHRVLELEKTYSDVTKPMKDLIDTVGKVTSDIANVSKDVDRLAQQGERVLGKIEAHDKIITDQGFRLKYVFWIAAAIGLLLVGYALNHFLNAIRSSPISTPSTTRP
jgi:deoxycytidine triphosphate deaminase